MSLIISDRVKETTVTPGTGRVTLDGPTLGGFQSFSSTIGDGNTTYYCIENGNAFEIGIGTYRQSDNTLSRDTVFQSSNSDTFISINGLASIFCVVPADKLVYKDGEDVLVQEIPLVLKRADSGDYWQALSTNYTNRVVSFYIQEGTDPTWKLGLKTLNSETVAPYYAYVSGKDGFIELRGNGASIISIGDGSSEGLQVTHEYQNILDLRNNGGEISVQNLNFNSDETTSAKNNSIANVVFEVESLAGHISNLQTWSVATNEKASINQDGDFQTVGDIISPSGRFDAIRFSDGTIQTTASVGGGGGLPYSSGDFLQSQIDINQSNINTVSGLLTPSGESFDFSTNILTYNNSYGGSFSADLSSLSTSDTSGVSLDYSAGTLTYTNNNGGTLLADLSSISGDVYALIVDGAPETLDTLNEIAAALNNDDNIATTLTNLITNTSGNLQFQITSNDSDISYISGIAVYASGHNLQSVTDNGSTTSNSITINNNNIIATSGLLDTLDMTPLAEVDYPAYQEGVMFYDVENHTLSLYNDEADVTLQLGQEEFLRVRNNTGATITNGTAVLIDGAHGNAAPTISGAIANSESSSQAVGLVTHDIEDNSFGYVTTYGIVRDIDTSSFTEGDEIYLSATDVGSGVNVSPVIPNYKVTLGHVIRSHSNGSILVQVGQPKLGGGDLKSEAVANLSGVPFVSQVADGTAGGLTTDPLFVYDSGNRQLQIGSGVQLLNGVPGNTSNVLYNNAGTLYFNGSAVDAGSTTYTAGTGITFGGLGTDISLDFNSSAIITESEGISSNDNDLSLPTSAAVKDYVDTNINSVSASITPNTFAITAGDGTNYTIDGMGLSSDSDPDIYLHKGHTYKFDKQISNHPFRISTSVGGAAYQDADGNSIEINGQGVLTFEVPQDAPDILYYYCTVHPSMNGRIYTTIDTSDSSFTAGSGLTLVGNEFNVYGGSGHFVDLDVDGQISIDTGTVTTSTPLIDAAQTWNDGAVTFTAMKLNITDTASASDSKLLDLQVGGTTEFSVDNTGAAYSEFFRLDPSLVTGIKRRWGTVGQLVSNNSSAAWWVVNAFHLETNSWLGWGSSTGQSTTLSLYRDADDILAQRRGTNAQEFRLYNTWTSPGTSYERAFLKWDTNVFTIGTEGAGTGSNRNIDIKPDYILKLDFQDTSNSTVTQEFKNLSGHSEIRCLNSNSLRATALSFYNSGGSYGWNLGLYRSTYFTLNRTANANLTSGQLGTDFVMDQNGQIGIGAIPSSDTHFHLARTWNNVSTTFTGIKLDVTDTASAADSLLMDLQVGGTSVFKVDKTGSLLSTGASATLGSITNPWGNIYASNIYNTTGVGRIQLGASDTIFYQSIRLQGTADYLGFDQGGQFHAGGANIIEQRNGANAQEFRIYNTYTSSTSYERASLKWDTNVFTIVTEADGTGTQQNLTIQSPQTNIIDKLHLYRTNTSNPTWVKADLTSGTAEISANNVLLFRVGGGGTLENLRLHAAGHTITSLLDDASADDVALTLNYTVNKAAGNDTGLLLNMTDTASPGTSLLTDLQVGGASKFNVNNIGNTEIAGYLSSSSSQLGIKGGTSANGVWICGTSLSSASTFIGGDVITLQSNGRFAWSPNTNPGNTPDLYLYRDDANTLAQRYDANAQEFRIYNTYTSSTVYERATLKWDANLFTISTESDGTGSARSIWITTPYNQSKKVYIGDAVNEANAMLGVDKTKVILQSIGNFGFSNGGLNGFIDAGWYRDAADVIAQRRSTVAQTYRIYNTYTSSTNYERAYLQWDTNTFKIGTEAGSGGGTVRDIEIDGTTTVTGANSTLTVNGNVGNASIKAARAIESGSEGGINYGIFRNANAAGTNYLQLDITQDTILCAHTGYGLEFRVNGSSVAATISSAGNMTVNGAFSATTKSFLIDHPSKPGMKLQYGSLEGPENGVYVRGTTNYEKIILPDYWKDLIDERTITVTLTPLHEFQPLFVKNKNCCEIEVGGCSGEYDYVVYGERKDVAKLEVEHWA